MTGATPAIIQKQIKKRETRRPAQSTKHDTLFNVKLMCRFAKSKVGYPRPPPSVMVDQVVQTSDNLCPADWFTPSLNRN